MSAQKTISTSATSEKEDTPAAKFIRATKSYTPQKTDWIPDWRNPFSYNIDSSKDDSSRWAWEFLRRNRIFQKYCDDPTLWESDGNDPHKWKPCWGLAKYKRYDSEYVPAKARKGPGSSQSPEWSGTTPARIIDRTIGPLRREGVYNVSLDLLEGQVAVIFDLNECVSNPNLLKMQTKFAQDKLDEALHRHSSKKATAAKGTKPWGSKLLTYLRVADALASDTTVRRADIGKKLFEERLLLEKSAPDPTGIEFSRAIEPHIEVIWSLIYEGGYLRLLKA